MIVHLVVEKCFDFVDIKAFKYRKDAEDYAESVMLRSVEDYWSVEHHEWFTTRGSYADKEELYNRMETAYCDHEVYIKDLRPMG